MQPCDSDPIDHITAEHESAAATLSKEARRWATKIARENNNIKESVRKLHLYNAMREAGQKVFFYNTNFLFYSFLHSILFYF